MSYREAPPVKLPEDGSVVEYQGELYVFHITSIATAYNLKMRTSRKTINVSLDSLPKTGTPAPETKLVPLRETGGRNRAKKG